MSYVKNYNVGQIHVDLPTPNYFHELPLISFGDIHGSMNLSLVFNYGMKVENRNHFHIAAGYKFNLQKRLIMSDGVPSAFQGENGKIINLNRTGDVYTFDDDTQRIMRKTINNTYEIENPDFSKDIFNSSGRITGVLDKYGVPVLSYSYNASTRLTSIGYRDKSIIFTYDGQNRLSVIKYKGKQIKLNYGSVSNGIQLAHYNGVTFTLTSNGINFTATATATENSTEVSYATKIEMQGVYALKTSDLIGDDVVDSVEYLFPSELDYEFKYNQVEITDKKGVKTRVQYQREIPLYSYEIDSLGNFPGGSVTVFNTVDASDNGSVSGEFNKNIGIGMTLMPSNQAWFYNAIDYEGANQEGYYVVSGWIRLTGDHAQPTMIVSDSITTRKFDFFPYAATDGSWRFFAYKFPIHANYIYLRPENPASSELKDVKIVFNPLSDTYNKQGGRFSLSEDVLIYHGGSGYQYIPFEKAEFTCGGENLSHYGRVCFEDVLKYKLNRNDYADEIYYDRCKNILHSSNELKVKYNGTESSIDNFYLGKRRVTSVKTVENSNQTQQIPVKLLTTVYKDDADSSWVCEVMNSSNTVLSSQVYDENLDVVSATVDGVTTVYTRDNDLILSESVDGIYTRTTAYGTDANGCPTITKVNEFNNTTVYTLDSTWGNVKSVTLPDGQTVTDEYDTGACAKLSRTFASGGRSNTYEYFGGNLSGAQSGALVYDFAYNKGNLSAVSKSGDQTEEHEISNTRSDSYYPTKLGAVYSDKATFDKYGRLISVEGVLTNTYDEAPSCVSNVYGVSGKDNASGKLAISTDLKTGNVRKYAYDADNLSKTATFNSSGTKINEDVITYDDINRVVEVKYNNLADSHSVKETQSYTVAATAANADNRVEQSKFYVGGINRVTATNTYDTYKRLSKKVINVGGYQATKKYSYNKTRLYTIAHVNGGETKYKYVMNFDSSQRIIRERDSNVNGYSIRYEYDAYGQLVRENNNRYGKTILYTYDGVGNITGAQEYNYTLSTVSGTPIEDTYTYSASYPDRLTIFNGKGITYDALGCVKSYDGWTYTWNKGKLTAMRKGPTKPTAIAPSEAYTFAYNALGQRIEKKYTFSANASQTIDYLTSCTSTYEYDISGRLIREKRVSKYSDGVIITRVFSFLYDGAEIVGLVYNNGSTSAPYYYEKNPSGDVLAILDSSGTAVVKYNYDAFGRCSWLESTNNDLAQSNPIRYRSYCYDEDTGLYYLNARYYNPQWRRFISPDSTDYLDLDSVNGLNPYAYCGNDPVNYKDPTGYSAIVVGLIIGAFVGAGIGFGTVAYTDYQDDGQIFNGSVVWYEYLGGTVTGSVLGAGVGGIIGAGGAVLISAISSVTNKLVSDLFAYTLTGTSFGTWEDYAVAFISGGLIKGLGMKGIVKTAYDVALRPAVNQVVKIGTNRTETFNTEKYAYDVVTRGLTTLAPSPWKAFYRGGFRSIWDIYKQGYFA